MPFLSGCAAIAPTFMSLGNHEWMIDRTDLATLAATGVTVLDNAWRSITVDGNEIILGGLTSGYVTDYRRFRAESGSSDRYPRQESISGIGGAIAASRHKPDLSWFSAFAAQPGYKIALSHHPEYWPLLKDENIDLIIHRIEMSEHMRVMRMTSENHMSSIRTCPPDLIIKCLFL